MPRDRSDDYEARSQKIINCAAILFSKVGYPSAKMQDIAEACGSTKSMLYHYFPTKNDLLFSMLNQHLVLVLAVVEDALELEDQPKAKLLTLVYGYTQKSAQARRRHMVAMQDVKYLPKEKQRPLIELQRKITNQVSVLLMELNPRVSKSTAKPYAMMLIGMLNWTDTWYSPSGTMKPKELCDRISQLFLGGFMAQAD